MMKAAGRIIPALLVATALIGCLRREPILNEGSRYSVRFNLDTAGVLYKMPEEPGRIQFSLYDIDTEKETFKTFLDIGGGYLLSVHPGTYKVAVWSMDSDFTTVTYPDRYNLLTAESKTAQETPVCVISAPDHVFAYSSEEIVIPYITEDDENVVFTIPLKSVIDTWKIEVDGVRNLENFSDASFLIHNQTKELYFKEWRRSGVAVCKAQGEVRDKLIVSEFGTFGMPDDGKIAVVVRISARNGFIHEKAADVTEQVRNPENTEHKIRIRFDTELNSLEEGGLRPSAEEWNENTEIIDLT